MMEILKIATTGSVDDGKSTLIGRLLYDTKSLAKDKIESIRQASEKRGDGSLDLSLITDGLMDEREQGITIDVAHIYFNSDKRKFIIADTPGHVEYTRNMITGASQSNISLILIDARKGVLEQTKRHLFIANLLRKRKALIVVNKMDLADYSEDVFCKISLDIQDYINTTGFQIPVDFIPVSSKLGENIVTPSSKMPWYKGTTLLEKLNAFDVESENLPGRFMIQTTIRPQSDDFHDFRAYAGKVKSGKFKVGQTVDLRHGMSSVIEAIYRGEEKIEETDIGSSVSITLKDDIDVSRGNWIFEKDTVPEYKKSFKSTIAWLNQDGFQQGTKYILQHGVNRQPMKVKSVESVWDIQKGEKETFQGQQIKMNDLFVADIVVANGLPIEPYKTNRNTGNFILIHPQTFQTVAVGVAEE